MNTVADKLRVLGVKGILITAAEQGHIPELACQMPECFCPEERGGRGYFEPWSEDLPPWMPSHDHIELKSKGGQRTIENTRLGHRLCNRVDYNKNHGISYAKDLATVDAARREARGQSPRDPLKLSDALVAPGDTLAERARFVKENLKDPQTKKNLADLVRSAPQDFITDMKDVVSVFRRRRSGPDEDSIETSVSQTPTPPNNEEKPLRELLTLEDFREAVAQDTPILNMDVPTATEVLHRRPQDCTGVEEKWFIQKVVENNDANGSYFAVSNEKEARRRWPQMTICQRCS